MHLWLQGATYHIEHIVPRRYGGTDDLENLALACPACNLHKGDRMTAIDPESNAGVAIFHSRREIWREHFEFAEQMLTAKNASGRTRLALLELNHSRKLKIREAETIFGLLPPDES